MSTVPDLPESPAHKAIPFSNSLNLEDSPSPSGSRSLHEIYRRSDAVLPAHEDKEEKVGLQCQKWWVLIHSVFYLLIAIQIMWLLVEKNEQLRTFYTQPQCCYCRWIAQQWNPKYNNDKQIEYAHCDQTYPDWPQICNIDNTQYCSISDPTYNKFISREKKLSTSSSFLFIPFDKSYLYYGILGIVVVVIYSAYIILVTFKRRETLSEFLFIGNIVVSILMYYNYIKVYQYAFTEYTNEPICDEANPRLPAETACYQNTVNQALSQCLAIMAGFFSVYFLYPFVYVSVTFCCVRKCDATRQEQCRKIRSSVNKALLYIALLGGLVSVFFCFVILMIVIQEGDIQFVASSQTDVHVQRVFAIVAGIALLIMCFTVFALPSWRKTCRSLSVKPTITRALSRPSTVETEQFEQSNEPGSYTLEQSADLTAVQKRTMTSTARKSKGGKDSAPKPSTPLLDKKRMTNKKQ